MNTLDESTDRLFSKEGSKNSSCMAVTRDGALLAHPPAHMSPASGFLRRQPAASERAATSDLNNFIIIVISLVYERVVLNTDRIYTRETTAHSKGLHNILFCFVAISERTSSRQIS